MIEDKKEKASKNLYQKLIEVRKAVKYIQKTAEGFKFKYADEGSLLGAIRDEMDNQGVFLEIEMISLEECECVNISDAKGIVRVPGLRAEFEFKWTDCDNPNDTIIKHVKVQHAESVIKTVGSLLTYANKYFLYKFFQVATGKLDPDSFDNNLDRIIDGNDEIEGEKPKNAKEDKKIEKEFWEKFVNDMRSLAHIEDFVKIKTEEGKFTKIKVMQSALNNPDRFIKGFEKWLAEKEPSLVQQ